jgi:hypothetical protein
MATSKKKKPVEGLTREKAEKSRKFYDSSYGRYFITAAVAGAPVDRKFLATVEKFCEQKKAKLIVLLMRGHKRSLEPQDHVYAPEVERLHKEGKAFVEYGFNSNLKALDVQVNPQQVLPLTGLTRYGVDGDKRYSVLVASPRQHMKILPSGNNLHPRMLHSTGAITLPDYQKNRLGRISTQDHVIGGLFVTLDKEKFHLTQVQADTDGSMVLYGKRHFPDGSSQEERAEAFVMGDLHAGFDCPKTMQAWYEVFQATQPKRVFLHDIMDGVSISHHLEHKPIDRLNRPHELSTLEKELFVVGKRLAEIKAKMPSDGELSIVASNHAPDHLVRYLDEGRYLTDPVNYALAHELMNLRIKGSRNILKDAVDPDSEYNWLDRNRDYIVEGFNLSVHGDKAANGSRGSPEALERTYGKGVSGHTHTPQIVHRWVVAGTSTKLRLSYNDGASSWLNASVVLYKNGLFQIVIAMDGRWTK